MMFPKDYSPVYNIILQDAEIFKVTGGRFDCLLEDFNDIISISSSGIGYTELIEMDIETGPNLPSVSSKPDILPSKHHE